MNKIKKNILKVLEPIMFEAEIVDFNTLVKGVSRLPFDRQYAIATYPYGRGVKPEIPYIGGEKYTLVQNSEVLLPLVDVLIEKIPNLKVQSINSSNEFFVVNFYSVKPDKINNEHFAPMVRFINSYNGKVKAKAKACLYRVDKDGNEIFLNNGSTFYEFKHHSESGTLAINQIADKVDIMLSEFNTITEKVQKLKDIPVGGGLMNTLHSIVPDSKKYPKKAIDIASKYIVKETDSFKTPPNLWLVYTALALAVKEHESEMQAYQREEADALAWANTLNYANIQ